MKMTLSVIPFYMCKKCHHVERAWQVFDKGNEPECRSCLEEEKKNAGSSNALTLLKQTLTSDPGGNK